MYTDSLNRYDQIISSRFVFSVMFWKRCYISQCFDRTITKCPHLLRLLRENFNRLPDSYLSTVSYTYRCRSDGRLNYLIATPVFSNLIKSRYSTMGSVPSELCLSSTSTLTSAKDKKKRSRFSFFQRWMPHHKRVVHPKTYDAENQVGGEAHRRTGGWLL